MEDILAERGFNGSDQHGGWQPQFSNAGKCFFKHADTIKPDIIVINYFIDDA